jgi:hypothetical protein
MQYVHRDAKSLPPIAAKANHRTSQMPVLFQVAETKYKQPEESSYRNLVECWDTSLIHHEQSCPPVRYHALRKQGDVSKGAQEQTLNTHK